MIKMNRADGLVQRRRVTANQDGAASANDGSPAEKNSPTDSEGSSLKDLNSNPALDEDSDKETRLTLMEEVLLLGLKDKEVCFLSYTLSHTWKISKILYGLLCVGVRKTDFFFVISLSIITLQLLPYLLYFGFPLN